ncbi:MAG: 50S ribosomal protein L18 [Planctomycetes bacterium]|nr:50S ribosomal protein L18 [Planctomycetota bacterium]
MYNLAINRVRQERRQLRVRRRLFGTTERPRLAVFRSSKHIYAQIIDDSAGRTLVSASTREPDVRSQVKSGGNKQAAEVVGQRLGRKAIEQGITKVAFDRRHYRFHGRVQALADAVRKAGLQF